MQPFEKLHEYSGTVCRQIRWRKAHPVITEEIENHLKDQRDAYIAEGADETAATDMAIAQMGDPVTVGIQLDRTHRPKPQWGMLVLTIAFVLIGLAFEILFMGERFNLLKEQIIGTALLAAGYFMDFTWIGKRPVRIYSVLVILFAVSIILRKTGVFSWDYEDSLLLLFPLGFAGVVYSTRNKGFRGIVLCGIAFLLPALMMLLVRQRVERSEFVLFSVSALVILCIAISKGWFSVKIIKAYLLVFLTIAVVMTVTAVIVLNDSGKMEKIQAAFNPSYASLDKDSFGTEIKAAVAGSKFIGQGVMPDASIQDPGYNVFCILTSLVFYVGWISVIPIIGLLLFFIFRGFRLCLKQKSDLALFVSVSVMITFTLQTIGYVLCCLGFDLLVPVSLPLIMQFDYSYYANIALVGIMLSVFRTGHIVKDRNISNRRTKDFAQRA